MLAGQLRQSAIEERLRPVLSCRAPHRSLLFAFTVATEHGEARPACESGELLMRFGRDGSNKCRIVIRIGHVREHEILP